MAVLQYIRKVSLLIETRETTNTGTAGNEGGGNTTEKREVIDFSQFSFNFRVEDSILQHPKNLHLKLFNLSIATEQKLLDSAYVVTLSAGYEGSFGVIFQGQITQIFRGKDNGVDTYITILAKDGNDIYNNGFVRTSIPAGTNTNARSYQIISSSTVYTTIDKIVSDKDTTSLRGSVHFGMLKDELRKHTNSNNQRWTIDNGKINIIQEGKYKDPEDITVLNHRTGLIGMPTQTYEGINVKCLLNPNITNHSIIKIDINSIQMEEQKGDAIEIDKGTTSSINVDGLYTVLYIQYEGETRGTSWYCNLTTRNKDKVDNKAQTLKTSNLTLK